MRASFRATARASLLFRSRGNRGDHTFDPQIPPSASLGGLLQLQLRLLRKERFPTWHVSNRIATLGRTEKSSPRVLMQRWARPRAGDGTSMFVALWEFEVKPGCDERFATVYGPEGDWVQLFRSHPN